MKSLFQFIILLFLVLLSGGEKGAMARICNDQAVLTTDICSIPTCTALCQKNHGPSAQGDCIESDVCACRYRC
ncbi:hypothetical protein ACJIZ3_022093 [Penstemon smallii]|uniref:Uncharacterized protein n=1 Tax=Penstemon smallii TaxID=265156 RepID=A0ABD3SND1_9LAMI